MAGPEHKTPRIGLDMHVVDGLHQGSRTHVLELFSRVVTLLPQCEFFVFLDQPEYLREHWPAFSRTNVHLVRMEHANPAKRLLVQLPGLAKTHRLDLLHTQYIVPAFCPCATAVTIHDVLFESHPEFFTRFFRVRSRLLMPRSARQSALVFTVSEYSKRELMQRYGIPEARLTVTMNGANLDRFTSDENGSLSLPGGLVPGGYILTVGRLEPRKNHVRLLQAYGRLHTPRPKLVLVGQRDFGYEGLLSEIERLHLGDDVVLMEDVSDTLLPALYRNALVFAYPTLAEGFGMPVIEAMASGVPVVTSSTTSLPEVAGDAAVFCDPLDVASIEGALRSALCDAPRRTAMIAKGLKRAQHFQWDEPAHRLAAAYETFLRC